MEQQAAQIPFSGTLFEHPEEMATAIGPGSDSSVVENGSQAKKAVLLSCDPGHDDAMAIILAGAFPSTIQIFKLRAVHG